MARFNLSFLAVFLTLALCALSLPTKRDNTNGLNLNSALEDLQVRTSRTDMLDDKVLTLLVSHQVDARTRQQR